MLDTEIKKPSLLIPFLARHGLTITCGVLRQLRGRPIAFSFNVADRCPNNCNCYWRAQARVKELSDDQVIAFFNRRRREGYLLADLVGGEPYVRPDLLEQITKIIPFNILVTSGVIPLRHLTHTAQYVSIDGATAEMHDAVRGSRGLYDRVVRNIMIAQEKGIRPILIHCVLNHMNYKDIMFILAHWRPLVNGMLFSTLTPIEGSGDDSMHLIDIEREAIIKDLHLCKDVFHDFLLMTHEMIDQLLPHPDRNPQNCSAALSLKSYDAAGNPIKQCILSEKAKCSECGCVVTLMQGGTLSKTLKYFPKIVTMR